MEYGCALRHRDYRSCLIGALAFYFFWRWHISGESFPCFRTSQDWYDIKVLKRDSSHITESFSGSTAASWISRVYKKSGIKSSEITHNRVSGCKEEEENEVQEAQVILFFSFAFFTTLLTIF